MRSNEKVESWSWLRNLKTTILVQVRKQIISIDGGRSVDVGVCSNYVLIGSNFLVKYQARLPAESENRGRGSGYFRRGNKMRYGEFFVLTQNLSLKVPLSGFHGYLNRHFPNIWRGLL